MADQISDAILDDFLRQDSEAKVACETFVSTGLVVICGEVRSESAYVDIQHVTRGVIDRIGYTKADYMFDSKSCGILSALHEQSPDINRGVVNEVKEEQGAGDQGMMFGYACNDTEEYMPLPLTLAHITLIELARIRREEPQLMPYLRPDAKSQYTIEYSDDHKPVRVHTIVVSTQHDDFPAAPGMIPGTPENDAAIQARIKDDIERIVIPRVIARLPERTRKLFESYYMSIPPVSSSSEARTGTPDSPAARLSWTPTEARARTEAEPSRARIPARWTARPHTLPATLPRTWWQPAWLTRYSSNWPMR